MQLASIDWTVVFLDFALNPGITFGRLHLSGRLIPGLHSNLG